MRYSSLRESEKCINEVISKYSESGYNDGVNEAYINKSFIYYMKMQYDSVEVCSKKVFEDSHNDLLCSMADISMMASSILMGQSKDFYNYRSDAFERLRHINEESNEMNEHQKRLYRSAQTQYHLMSLRYFLKMRQEEGVKEHVEWLDKNLENFSADSTLLSSYLSLKSTACLIDNINEESLSESRRYLVRLLSLSTTNKYEYLRAVAMYRLARSIKHNGELKPSQNAFVRELAGIGDEQNLGRCLVEKSIDLFTQYNSRISMVNAYITLSNFQLSDDDTYGALESLGYALNIINQHHHDVNVHRCSETKEDILYPYHEYEDTLSTEMKWILNPDIIAVPEWMAGVREQLSVVYGAMGLKMESDYNHNIYFDILDATRQDQRGQQEKDKLNNEEKVLNILIVIFVFAIVLLNWAVYVFNKRSKAEYRIKLQRLSEVIDICKNMTTALSDDFEDEEELVESLHSLTDNDVKNLFPSVNDDWTASDIDMMKGFDKELFSVLIVFFRWIKEKGMIFINFTNDERKIESDTYSLEKKFEEGKKQYLEKLTSMSIVNGITPFLDRAIREVAKIKESSLSSETQETEAKTKERLQYISELIDKINEYNDVLGHWIKMRKGLVMLSVENFAIQPLLDTLKLNAKTFENKRIKLLVNDSAATIKADRSLTLFMMNTLLDNARKYTKEGGQVELSASETEEYVEISVQDSGVGLSEEDLDTLNNSKVYDSSKIGTEGNDSEAVKENKGYGFGLMNCKGIIEKYRKTNPVFSVCKFGVDSQVGVGSRFYFRLPKGVAKLMSLVLLAFITYSCSGNNESVEFKDNVSAIDKSFVSDNHHIVQATIFSDSLYESNVVGEYDKALLFADSALQELNAFYLEENPKGENLMVLEGGKMTEVLLWQSGFKTDYNLIISIRNEVAISALALNRTHLYHYNAEIFTRLYNLLSADNSLEESCNALKQANRNRKTIVILLGLAILSVIVLYFFLNYRNNQLFIFNLRQFLHLNKKIFSYKSENIEKVLHDELSDIKQLEAVCVMLVPNGADMNENAVPKYRMSGNVENEEIFKSIMRSAFHDTKEVKSVSGNMRAYPLSISMEESSPVFGAIGIRFRDSKLTADEELILDLVLKLFSIHLYFSFLKVDERNLLLEEKADELKRTELEQQRVHIQNMIMDNCLSALKHETMYYPNRMKQIVDTVLIDNDIHSRINDIDELLSYYKQVFAILSTCAGKQVERVLFKRTSISAQTIAEMTKKSFNKLSKKQSRAGLLSFSKPGNIKVLGDKIFIQMLVDNVLSLYFEHKSGGDLNVSMEKIEGFVKFVFTDTQFEYDEKEIPSLFYVDNVKYNKLTDSLDGVQYMLIRQIIREHDRYSSNRGCRVYVENNPSGGSNFVFTLPM